MSTDLSMTLRTASAELGELTARMAAATERLATHRVSWSSDGVRVVVDGNARLLQIEIAEECLRGAHPQRLGARLTEAIQAARTKAAADSRDVLAEAVGPDRAQAWLSGLPAVPGVANRSKAARRGDDVDEEPGSILC